MAWIPAAEAEVALASRRRQLILTAKYAEMPPSLSKVYVATWNWSSGSTVLCVLEILEEEGLLLHPAACF